MHWEWQEGRLIPLPEFPAGLLYGYAVYTTFRRPQPDRWLAAHWQRLRHDAQILELNWDEPFSLLTQILAALPDAQPVVRLTVLADVDGYGDFYRPGDLPCRLLVSTRSTPDTRPVRLKTAHYQRALPGIKLAAIPEIIRLKRQAMAEGFDDILLLNPDQSLSESSTANIFLIRDGQLWTPDPERDRCLPGITRLQVLKAAESLGMPANIGTLPGASLNDRDEVFLSNAAQGLIPVSGINALRFNLPVALLERFRAGMN